jgi:hypothetical protein
VLFETGKHRMAQFRTAFLIVIGSCSGVPAGLCSRNFEDSRHDIQFFASLSPALAALAHPGPDRRLVVASFSYSYRSWVGLPEPHRDRNVPWKGCAR